MATASVVVVSNLWGQVAHDLAEEAAKLRQETADAIKVASVANAAEITGALKASHYVTDERGSGYQNAAAAALTRRPEAHIMDEVPAEPETSIVAVAVSYAAPAEYYTGPTNPDAHPYLTPAAEAERPKFDAAVAALGGRI